MLGDDVEFILGKFPRLEQYMVRSADLTNIVHGTGGADQITSLARQPVSAGEEFAIVAHALNMLRRGAVAVLRRNREPLNRFFPREPEFLLAPFEPFQRLL